MASSGRLQHYVPIKIITSSSVIAVAGVHKVKPCSEGTSSLMRNSPSHCGFFFYHNLAFFLNSVGCVVEWFQNAVRGRDVIDIASLLVH